MQFDKKTVGIRLSFIYCVGVLVIVSLGDTIIPAMNKHPLIALCKCLCLLSEYLNIVTLSSALNITTSIIEGTENSSSSDLVAITAIIATSIISMVFETIMIITIKSTIRKLKIYYVSLNYFWDSGTIVYRSVSLVTFIQSLDGHLCLNWLKTF